MLIMLASSCSSAARNRGAPPPEDRQIALAEYLHSRPKIVIDAGHGGKDLGAQAKTVPVTQEKALNLQTAVMLEAFLRKMGYQTILTRGDDYFVPLDLRAQFANSNEATVFVSVHYNSAPSKEAEGVEVYFYEAGEENAARSQESRLLAESVLEQIVKATECRSRGVKHGNFAVIRETKMPAILVEGGFVSNEKELGKLRDPDYLKTLAGSIAIGVRTYLSRANRG